MRWLVGAPIFLLELDPSNFKRQANLKPGTVGAKDL